MTTSPDPKPQPPIAPEPGDCCGGGCVSCVFDLYDVAFERYETEFAAWLSRHPDAQT
jgi:hypothetical protein